jgi:hypothetical protein
MKLSISISDEAGQALQSLAKAYDASVSVVAEAAIRALGLADGRAQRRAILDAQASKRPMSASGWRSTFWTVLAEEFDATDFDHGSGNRVMTMRTHMGFNINFLLRDTQNSDPDALIVHIWAAGSRTHFVGTTVDYALQTSVYQAARETADWIRSHQGDLMT